MYNSKPVAIKRLHKMYQTTKEWKFKLEIELSVKLNHDNIIRAYGMIEEVDGPNRFLCMVVGAYHVNTSRDDSTSMTVTSNMS